MEGLHEVSHPGVTLGQELEEFGLSAAEFSRLIRVPTNRITEIVAGRRGVTPDTALRLERFFGGSAFTWMEMQIAYDLYVALKASGKMILALPTIEDLRAE
jgi:addiction module HigA family antidote